MERKREKIKSENGMEKEEGNREDDGKGEVMKKK